MPGPSFTVRKLQRGYTWEVTAHASDDSPEAIDAALAQLQALETRLQAAYGTESPVSDPQAPASASAPTGRVRRKPRRTSGNAAALAERVILARLDGGAATRAELISGLNGTTTGAEVLDDLVRVGDLVCADGVYKRA